MKRTGTIITLLVIVIAFSAGIWYIYSKDKMKKIKRTLQRMKYRIVLTKHERIMMHIGSMTILESQQNRNFRRSLFRTSFAEEFIRLLRVK